MEAAFSAAEADGAGGGDSFFGSRDGVNYRAASNRAVEAAAFPAARAKSSDESA